MIERLVPGADPRSLRQQIEAAGIPMAGAIVNYAELPLQGVGVHIPAALTSQQIADLDAAIAGHANPTPAARVHWSQITGIPDLGGGGPHTHPWSDIRNTPTTLAGYGITDGGIPAGVIVMWAGTLASIPAGWALCDGANGRPDLRDRFIKGWAAGVEPGTTGGAPTHIPSGAISWPAGVPTISGIVIGDHAAHTHGVTSNVTVAAHADHTHAYTQVPNHVHVEQLQGGTTGTTTGTHLMGSAATGGSLRAAGQSTANPTGGVASATTAGASASLTHVVTNNPVTSGNPSATLSHVVSNNGTLSWPAGVPTFVGASVNHEPAFYKLAFIIKL